MNLASFGVSIDPSGAQSGAAQANAAAASVGKAFEESAASVEQAAERTTAASGRIGTNMASGFEGGAAAAKTAAASTRQSAESVVASANTMPPAFQRVGDNVEKNVRKIPVELKNAATNSAWQQLRDAATSLMGHFNTAFAGIAGATALMGNQFGMVVSGIYQVGAAFAGLATGIHAHITASEEAKVKAAALATEQAKQAKAAAEAAVANGALAVSEDVVGVSAATASVSLGAFLLAILPIAVGLAALVAVLGAVGGGFLAIKSGVEKAAQFETFNVQMAVLLGTFEKADARMKELAKFAAETPFELPGVVQASITLQRYGGDLLATGKGLKEIGDAASMAQQPIEMVAMHMGRVYDALKNHQPIGEATMELNRLGIISGQTKTALELMGKEGTKSTMTWQQGWAMVEKDMLRANNSMKIMSTTWTGIMSNMSDNWGALLRALGMPIMQALKPAAAELADWLITLVPIATQVGETIASAIRGIHAAIEVAMQPGGMQLSWDAAVESFSNLMRRAWEAIGIIATAIMARIAFEFDKAMQTDLSDPAFWAPVKVQLIDMADGFVQAIKDGFKDVIEALNQAKEMWDSINGTTTAKLGGAISMGDFSKMGLSSTPPPPKSAPTIPSWSEAMGQTSPGDTTEADKYKKLYEDEKQRLEAISKSTRDNSLLPGAAGIGEDIPTAKAATAEWKKMQHEAEQVIKGIQTPAEKLKETMDQLTTLKDAGLLSEDQFARATKKASDDYVKAVNEMAEKTKTPFQKLIQSWTDVKKQTQELSMQMTQALGNDISGGLTDFITGTKSAKEAFTDMANSILKDITGMIVKMLIEYALGSLMGWFTGTQTGASTQGIKGANTGIGSGSLGGSSYKAGKFAFGGTVGSGDKPVQAEKGEVVLTRDKADDIKRRMGEGTAPAKGGAGGKDAGNLTIVNVQNMEEIAQHLVKNPGIVINVISNNQRAVKRALNLK